MSSLLEAVEEIIELLDGSILPIEKLGVTFERLRDLLEDSSKRRAERQLRRSAEDFDQDEAEALEVKLPFIAPLHLPNVTPCQCRCCCLCRGKYAALLVTWNGTLAAGLCCK